MGEKGFATHLTESQLGRFVQPDGISASVIEVVNGPENEQDRYNALPQYVEQLL